MGQNQVKTNAINKISVYSDGSGNTFDSDGGWGYRIILNGEFITEANGYAPVATNNTMELQGAIEGLQYVFVNLQHLLPCQVELVSDSQLVLGYASGRYKCKALHLTQLYIKLRQLYKELNCETRWVRGHTGDPNNEACDKLAKAARLGKGLTGIICQIGQKETKSILENTKNNIETIPKTENED